MQDSCLDGAGIQFRFFDVDNLVVWPAALTNTYQTLADGQTVFQDISCIPGATICYGAEPNPTDGVSYWGLSVTGDQDCAGDCCAPCAATNLGVSLLCE
jgi:hypothetical protein